jgi:hypothetical protein
MPTYCYKTADGEMVEKVLPIGGAPRFIMHGKRKAWRCYQAERASVPSPAGWPVECMASGVHASQAGELRDHLASKGVPTQVTRDGNPIYMNSAHRRRALKARGMIDRSSFV